MVTSESLLGNNYKKVIPHAMLLSIPVIAISLAVLVAASTYSALQSEEMLKSRGYYDSINSSDPGSAKEYFENLSEQEKLEMAINVVPAITSVMVFWSVVSGLAMHATLAVFIIIGIRKISKSVPMVKYTDKCTYSCYMSTFTFFIAIAVMYLMTGVLQLIGFSVLSLGVIFGVPALSIVNTGSETSKISQPNPSC